MTFTYTVTGVAVVGQLAYIELVPDEDGWSKWRPTMNTKDVVLVSVEEEDTPIQYVNPFGSDAWIAKKNQSHRIILHDFPKIPDYIDDESRNSERFRKQHAGFHTDNHLRFFQRSRSHVAD